MSDEVVSLDGYPRISCSLSLLQYECLVFGGKEHVRFANLPGMFDRTVTVGSAGSQ